MLFFFLRFRKGEVNTQRVFPDFRQKDAEQPEPAKSQQGDSSLGPVLPHRCFMERHQIGGPLKPT